MHVGYKEMDMVIEYTQYEQPALHEHERSNADKGSVRMKLNKPKSLVPENIKFASANIKKVPA
jgi:hypothetical protein